MLTCSTCDRFGCPGGPASCSSATSATVVLWSVSNPNGLPRPFRLAVIAALIITGLFQTRTGFPGHSDRQDGSMGYHGLEVSNTHGHPPPFLLGFFMLSKIELENF